MKEKERQILKAINDNTGFDLSEVGYEYCRFDSHDDAFIVEIKNRGKYYKRTLIEFDKYTFNKEFAKLRKKQFLYVVGHHPGIYMFNITALDDSGYDYKWQWREMPRQTEFGKTEKIYKFVGYIEMDKSIWSLVDWEQLEKDFNNNKN